MHRSRIALRAGIASLSVLAAACAPLANPISGPEGAYDPAKRFPIAVEPHMETLRLPYYGPNAPLDPNTRAQLDRFAMDYLDHGSGAIAVSAPNRLRDAPNDYAARLVGLGVPQERILIGNQDDPNADDTVKITYIRYQAQSPSCGDWSKNLSDTSDNKPAPDFGCATRHNLAAQVSDPRDLVSPKPSDLNDAQRRLTVLEKYRKGEATVTEKAQGQSAGISSVAGGGM